MNAQHLTTRLLRALDTEYNVVDMHAIDEVISVLENINITKELLEATRLGKHVNELRRRTGDAALARRTKLLVKRWRDLVIPDKAGSKSATQPTSAESTPRQSPLANRGISPAVTPSVTPRLCSPQISTQSSLNTIQKQDGVKYLQHMKRQPLTSPALHNLSPGLKNSQSVRNSSPNFKNVTAGQKNISPSIINSSPSIKNISSGIKNLSPGVTIVSPALRVKPETVWNITPSKESYDSDSNDVIFVDDTVDDEIRTLGNNSDSNTFKEQSEKCSNKRSRSPVNGSSGEPILADEIRREAKKARRESGGRKAKKRRNHTKSENRTVDHSSDPISVGSPFLPISSASTSPALSTSGALRNGLKIPTPPVVSVIVDDVDSRSSTSASDSKSKSRKNGCKKPSIEVDEYSNFIKNKIPTGGRKVKTTKELLEEMQAKKSGKIPILQNVEKKQTPREDFLTAYDSKKLKKEAIVVTDIIELNDSNSSSKLEEHNQSSISSVKDEKKVITSDKIGPENDGKPVKFEPVDVILARLPPIDKNWRDKEDYIPDCTCTIEYDVSDMDVKVDIEPKISMFDHDKMLTKEASMSPSGIHNFKERLDPDCPAAEMYNKQSEEISDYHIQALHNLFISDVNGSKCENSSKNKPLLACRMSSWGLRPYYDCSRDLFHNVVPKYNYLDYSLDKCIKNLSNIVLDKYEPVEATQESTEWFLNLENEFFEKWTTKNENLTSDDYESAADSPFSEQCDDQDESETIENKILDSEKTVDSDKNNLNVDRNESNLSHIESDEKKSLEVINKKSTENNSSESEKIKDLCSFFDFTGYGLISQSQLVKKAYPQELLMDNDDESLGKSEVQNEINTEIKTECIDFTRPAYTENHLESNYVSYVPKTFRKFTYEDAISLLPLSLSALNASAAYGCNTESSGDLSCIFRTKFVPDDTHHIDDDLSSKETCDLSYSLVQNANILEMKDISSTIMKRTRDVFLSDHNEDANCDSDIKKLDFADRLTNSGAFESDSAVEDEKCVKNGCPSWIPGSVPSNAFREWHEPVLRTSYDGETLTILPYVVID